jgi:hypothetical protein
MPVIGEKVTTVIFEGGQSKTSIEEQMTSVRKEVVLDTIEKLRAVKEIDEVILCTNYRDLAEKAAPLGAVIDFDDDSASYHFGRRLAGIVNKRNLENVIYMGGVAAPLITTEELQQVALDLKYKKNVVITNNIQSADVIAWTPGKAINHIELPSADNILGFLLRKAGMQRILIPNSPRVNFDLDTPTDILILGMREDAGERAKKAIARLDWDAGHIRRATEVFATPDCHVVLSGRVGPPVMQFISMNMICHLRVYSEERGMKALGREEKGEVISFVGQMIDLIGPEAFYRNLARLCQVAFIDTRVLFAHKKLAPSDWDRFNSDLGRVDVIKDPYIKDFTEKAFTAEIPVVLGGHALISGGIWLISEAIAEARRRSQNDGYV